MLWRQEKNETKDTPQTEKPVMDGLAEKGAAVFAFVLFCGIKNKAEPLQQALCVWRTCCCVLGLVHNLQ